MEPGPYSDIVLSTEVGLRRNLFYVPFREKQGKKDVRFVDSVAERFVKESEFSDSSTLVNLSELDILTRKILREKEIISQKMYDSPDCSLIINSDFNFSILINEEDHFRICSVEPGFQVAEACKLLDELDDELNKFAVYAFTDNLGYITANPVNMGTGMSVLVFLHLPVLSMIGKLSSVRRIVRENGLLQTGIRGETSKTSGALFKIFTGSDQGLAEIDMINNVMSAIHQIIDMESESRDEYIAVYRDKLEDQIYRSYGILKYAGILRYMESLAYLSDIRLGIVLSIVRGVDLQKINDIIIEIQCFHLEKNLDKTFLNSHECDIFRAKYIKEQLRWSCLHE